MKMGRRGGEEGRRRGKQACPLPVDRDRLGLEVSTVNRPENCSLTGGGGGEGRGRGRGGGGGGSRKHLLLNCASIGSRSNHRRNVPFMADVWFRPRYFSVYLLLTPCFSTDFRIGGWRGFIFFLSLSLSFGTTCRMSLVAFLDTKEKWFLF